MVFSYLDDCCLAGEQHAVAEAFNHLRTAAAAIGLNFNTDKFEIIPTATGHSQVNASLFPTNATFRLDATVH